MNEKILLTRKDAAAILSISLRSVDYLASRGTLKTVAIGGRRLIPLASCKKLGRTGAVELIV